MDGRTCWHDQVGCDERKLVSVECLVHFVERFLDLRGSIEPVSMQGISHWSEPMSPLVTNTVDH